MTVIKECPPSPEKKSNSWLDLQKYLFYERPSPSGWHLMSGPWADNAVYWLNIWIGKLKVVSEQLYLSEWTWLQVFTVSSRSTSASVWRSQAACAMSEHLQIRGRQFSDWMKFKNTTSAWSMWNLRAGKGTNSSTRIGSFVHLHPLETSALSYSRDSWDTSWAHDYHPPFGEKPGWPLSPEKQNICHD